MWTFAIIATTTAAPLAEASPPPLKFGRWACASGDGSPSHAIHLRANGKYRRWSPTRGRGRWVRRRGGAAFRSGPYRGGSARMVRPGGPNRPRLEVTLPSGRKMDCAEFPAS